MSRRSKRETKVTTVRQDAEQAAELEAVARVDGVPVAEVIRTAIAVHIATRRQDPEFRKRLARRIEEDQAVLRRIDGGATEEETNDG